MVSARQGSRSTTIPIPKKAAPMFSRKTRRGPVAGPLARPNSKAAQTPKTTAGAPGVSADGSDGGYNAGIAVFSYIVGGIIVWSLIGWGLDNLWGAGWIVLAGA